MQVQKLMIKHEFKLSLLSCINFQQLISIQYIIISQRMIQERYLTFSGQKKYKYILVGNSSVGKTALFWRFIDGDFAQGKNTLVTTVDFKMRSVLVNGKSVKLYIWDTAGQEKYRSMVSTYFRGCHGIFLVFDLNEPQSFEQATQQWYEICKAKAEKAIIYLVGSKADLGQAVSNEIITKCCRQLKLKYIKTSAKTGENVEELFMEMTKSVMAKQQRPEKAESFTINAKQHTPLDKKKKCC